jgi:Methane oxygenase PmoA
MAWMHRSGQLPVLAWGAVMIASCSARPPLLEGYQCEFTTSASGVLVCVPPQPGGSTGVSVSGDGNAGGPVSVPDVSEGSPTAGGDRGESESVSVLEVGVPVNPTLIQSSPEGSGPSEGSGGTTEPVGTPLGSIRVSANDLARDHSVVTFPLPDAQGKSVTLVDAQGNQLPLQMGTDGNVTFILPSLGAGQQALYTIEELSAPRPAAVTAAVEANQLFVKVGDSQVFRWVLTDDNFRNRAANDVRSGYIHPLRTPAGLAVTDDYAEDHPHMHGLWSSWTNTTFRSHKVDFWNGYLNQGHVDLESMDGAWSGPVHAGLIANLAHTDISTEPDVRVLNEKWLVTVYKTHEGAAPYFLLDIDSTQVTAGNDPLILDQYHYGGFGFRGAEEWAVGANVSYLTSEGHTRQNADGQNARWVAQFGNVGGQTGGYAALGHPSNVRSPQGLRVHPSNPYWAFVPVTPLKGGRYTIEAGVPYRTRFRVVSFDGPANADLLNQIWNDYATPPTVEVLPPA